MITLTKTFVAEMMAALIAGAENLAGDTFPLTGSAATDGALAGLQVGVYTNTIVPSPDLTIDDLDEPVYGTYARVDLAWNSPRVKTNGDNSVVGSEATFQMEDGDDQTQVAGFFVARDGDDNPLKWVEKLDTPITLIEATDAITYIANFITEITSPATGVVV